MKDFRLLDIPDFVIADDFIRYLTVSEARQILESLGTEQKVISEAEKQHEIERLMQTIQQPFN